MFGRMVKTTIEITNNSIDVFPEFPRVDYQSWSFKYATVEDLLLQAMENLEKEKGI
jgi:hypothetical protein